MPGSVHVESEIPLVLQAGNASCHGHPGVEGSAKARCGLTGLGVVSTGFSTGGWVGVRACVCDRYARTVGVTYAWLSHLGLPFPGLGRC